MPDTGALLGRTPLFAGLPPADLAAIAGRLREDRFLADATIFREGDEAARFWLVGDGQVKIVKHGEAGREIAIEVISPGEVFGAATLLMTEQPAGAQALSDVTTLSLPVDEYRRLLLAYPAVAVRVIEMLGSRLLGTIRMRIVVGERVERRIAHILLKLAGKCGEPTDEGVRITISLSRQDIAELADTTTESAIRVLSRFNRDGWVKTLPGGYVVLLDRDALRQLAE